MPDQWIVGYGSLMNRASRARQAPRAQSAFPVKDRDEAVRVPSLTSIDTV